MGNSPETKVVLYVGRFDPRKGIETLVRAVSLSALRGKADLKLIIGGGWRSGESDGKERDRIGSIVQELGLSDITRKNWLKAGTRVREKLKSDYSLLQYSDF